MSVTRETLVTWQLELMSENETVEVVHIHDGYEVIEKESGQTEAEGCEHNENERGS